MIHIKKKVTQITTIRKKYDIRESVCQLTQRLEVLLSGFLMKTLKKIYIKLIHNTNNDKYIIILFK